MPISAESVFEPFVLRIPASNHEGDTLEVEMHNEDRLFVVGPNGSGKSALIQHFVSLIGNRPNRRISAHRQTWLSSSTIEMTPRARRDVDRSIFGREQRQDARWKDDNAAQRLSAVLFDLVAAENQRSREIANLVDQNNVDQRAYSRWQPLGSDRSCDRRGNIGASW
jgi:energy-coupling factor transporter ATP-binding protein EcfA2